MRQNKHSMIPETLERRRLFALVSAVEVSYRWWELHYDGADDDVTVVVGDNPHVNVNGVQYDATRVDVYLGDGNDTLTTTKSPAVSNGAVLNIWCENGIDVVDETGVWASTVHGGAGDDAMQFTDLVGVLAYGEAGNDSLYAVVTNAANMQTTFYGGDGADLIDASASYNPLAANTLDGGAGVDRIYGSDYEDEITGGDDEDYLWGNAGDDTFYAVDGRFDYINGGEGGETNGDTAYVDHHFGLANERRILDVENVL